MHFLYSSESCALSAADHGRKGLQKRLETLAARKEAGQGKKTYRKASSVAKSQRVASTSCVFFVVLGPFSGRYPPPGPTFEAKLLNIGDLASPRSILRCFLCFVARSGGLGEACLRHF